VVAVLLVATLKVAVLASPTAHVRFDAAHVGARCWSDRAHAPVDGFYAIAYALLSLIAPGGVRRCSRC
jgi:hypothetical protein